MFVIRDTYKTRKNRYHGSENPTISMVLDPDINKIQGESQCFAIKKTKFVI